MKKIVFVWLQEWYKNQCDGDWEHEYGIKIERWTIWMVYHNQIKLEQNAKIISLNLLKMKTAKMIGIFV